MQRVSISFAAGLLFGLGLILAGMEQPSVILNAFAFSSRWDPRLLLLFAGANLVHAPVSAWLRRRGSTLRGVSLRVVPSKVDGGLIVGSLLFGVGWGLGGICPGPGITAALSFSPHALVFLATFGVGIALHARLHAPRPATQGAFTDRPQPSA